MATNNNNGGRGQGRGQGQGSQGGRGQSGGTQQGFASQFAGADPQMIIAVAAATAVETVRQLSEGGTVASLGGIGQSQGSQSQGGQQSNGSGRQGFASMPREQVQEIAAQGGRASRGGNGQGRGQQEDGEERGRPGARPQSDSAMSIARKYYEDNINSDMSRRDMINDIVEMTGSKKQVINTYISNIDKDNGGILKQRTADARAQRAAGGNGGQGRSTAGAQDGRRNNRGPGRAASARGGRNSNGGQGRTGTNG